MKTATKIGSEVPRFDTVYELIHDAFARYSQLPAYSNLGCTLSYQQINERSERLASYLRNKLDLQVGDRVAVQLPNILQFPVVTYALIKAGLVAVNVNPLYTARELLHQLNDSEAKALIVLSNIAHTAASIIHQTKIEHVIVTNLADELPAPKRYLINFVVKLIKKLVPKFEFVNEIPYAEISKHRIQAVYTPTPSKDDLLVLQYTGGTTGLAKGAMLSQGNLATNVWQLRTHLPESFEPAKETYLACLPLYHIYAYNLHTLSGFSAGGHSILITNPRDFNSLCEVIERSAVTVLVAINTLLRGLVHDERFRKINFQHLKMTSAGGMALTEDVVSAWKELTGLSIVEGYGLTETSPVVAANRSGDTQLASIGFALPETELAVLDESGEIVNDGDIGELSIRGPQVMQGYWNNRAETDKAFTDKGFFKTGDMAVKHAGGRFSIVDRKKDMICVSGFNVYPNEIEEILSLHEGIREAAVIGIDEQKTGEAVKAYIVKENEALTHEEVVAYCRTQLTAYKMPKHIEFTEELPKSNVGKVLRRKLRSSEMSKQKNCG